MEHFSYNSKCVWHTNHFLNIREYQIKLMFYPIEPVYYKLNVMQLSFMPFHCLQQLIQYVLVTIGMIKPYKCILLRCVHTMKVMHIGSKLTCIVCVHTEYALTAVHIECAFSQSTSIHRWFETSLKVNCIMTLSNVGVIIS